MSKAKKTPQASFIKTFFFKTSDGATTTSAVACKITEKHQAPAPQDMEDDNSQKKKTPLKMFKSRRNSARRPITLRHISGTAHPAGSGLAIAVKIFSTFQLLNVDYGYEKTCLTVVP